MTPSARIAAAIEILEGLETSAMPADRFIREFFRARRYAGSKDRAAVAAHVYDVYRHRAAFAHRLGSERPRCLMLAALQAEGLDEAAISALFTGEGHAPAPLSAAEQRALTAPPALAPLWVEGEFPAFLEADLRVRFGARLSEEMAAMAGRAPVDLRVNTLKSSRASVAAALAKAGYSAQDTPLSPLGLRLPAGAAGLERSGAFEAGAFEFQDEAAQLASLLCDARPGMSVLDLAAGAGGKSLALSAQMENRGQLIASDIAAGRLAQLDARAERAGARLIRSTATPRGVFDRVLVDAPCSGSGTWRRQPEQKWRLTQARLAELTAIQDGLLTRAAGFVAPGGRLIYATCSVLPVENEARIAAFLAAQGEFALLPVREVWQQTLGAPPPAAGTYFLASPLSTGTDGFFTAIAERQG